MLAKVQMYVVGVHPKLREASNACSPGHKRVFWIVNCCTCSHAPHDNTRKVCICSLDCDRKNSSNSRGAGYVNKNSLHRGCNDSFYTYLLSEGLQMYRHEVQGQSCAAENSIGTWCILGSTELSLVLKPPRNVDVDCQSVQHRDYHP